MSLQEHGAQRRVMLRRPVTSEDLDLYERIHLAACRDDFYTYRKYITPGLIEGWYQAEVAEALQQFFWDWKTGESPVLVLEAPPQHGKSRQVIDFITWASGHDVDLKTIYTSYSDALGNVANTTIQRIMDSPRYKKVFPNTTLAGGAFDNTSKAKRNSDILEFVGSEGSFRNTTVRGQITGLGLGLGIIDDPIKGREEASSLLVRDKTWNWFTDDFFSRFAENAALLMIMTRWHLDDPVGRFIERYPNARVMKYSALGRVIGGEWVAEEDVKSARALFPELKSKDFLLKRKKLLTKASWESLYQQSPIVVGGDLFPVDQFRLVKVVPVEVRRSVRYWDKAGTEGGGARTAGVLMHQLTNGRYLVEDVITGQWSALRRELRIKQTCELDNKDRLVETWVEQEPGSGGKESAESTIRNLAGFVAFMDRVTGKKEVRADPYAAQVQAGNVDLLIAPWNKMFIDEHEMFPNGKFKDQVDATGAAFIKLTIRDSDYDTSMSWVTNDDSERTIVAPWSKPR